MEAKLTIASYNIHGSGENVLKLLDEVELDIIAINEAYKVENSFFLLVV